MELLLGCGHARQKRLFVEGREQWNGLVTLDMNPDTGADVLHDLMALPLPFAASSADEIHLYDVLEHTGAQGDWLWFFRQFGDLWRILKPGGLLFAIVPRADGVWAWADPGHTRVILPETLTFLSQAIYAAELDGETPTNRTDYRRWWQGDFEVEFGTDLPGPCFGFVLRAIKPARIG